MMSNIQRHRVRHNYVIYTALVDHHFCFDGLDAHLAIYVGDIHQCHVLNLPTGHRSKTMTEREMM